MKPSIFPTAFIFGVPDPLPVIPGFVVTAYEDDFLCAIKGEKLFIVEEFMEGFRLSERLSDGRHWCCRFDQSFWIPRGVDEADFPTGPMSVPMDGLALVLGRDKAEIALLAANNRVLQAQVTALQKGCETCPR